MNDYTITKKQVVIEYPEAIETAWSKYTAYDEKLSRKYGRHSEWDALPGQRAYRQRLFNNAVNAIEECGLNAMQVIGQLATQR